MNEATVSVTGPGGSLELQVPWSITLGELFEKARTELGLATNGYELWCEDGTTMINKLERTLQELQDRRICPARRYAIRALGRDRAG